MYVKNTFNSFLYRKADTAEGGGVEGCGEAEEFFIWFFFLILLQGV